MRKVLFNVFFVSLIFLLTEKGFAQDRITTNSGKTIKCNISKITLDSVFFKVKLNDRVSNTFITTNLVKEYYIGKIEELKKDIDTNSIYFLRLEDGTGLTGKPVSIFDSKLQFKDNNFGIIIIKGETIESFTKEDKTAFYQITLVDGSEISGQILERRKTDIDIQTKTLGKVTIPLQNIKKMREIEQGNMKDGQYWFPNPNNTRYFFSPTAIPLKKGEGYYQNIYVISNSANVGVTDNFSVGGGVILPVVAFLSPKVGFKVAEKIHVGAGAIVALMPGPTALGIFYGIGTYGTDEHNVTIGAGYGFADEEFFNRPIITLSAMTRVSKRIALVTENWGVPYRDYLYVNGQEIEELKYYTFFSYGMRIMKEKITFDVALVNSKDIFEFFPIGIPYIDFVYKF